MRKPMRRIVLGGLAATLGLSVTGCQHAPWRREGVPPERAYVIPPTSGAAGGAPMMSEPRVGFSTEPASNGYSNTMSVPAAGAPATGFGSASDSGAREPSSGIPGLAAPGEQVPAGVMGTSGQAPSPL
jgi:hypothetical protein